MVLYYSDDSSKSIAKISIARHQSSFRYIINFKFDCDNCMLNQGSNV
jgi:hypothetical protein